MDQPRRRALALLTTAFMLLGPAAMANAAPASSPASVARITVTIHPAASVPVNVPVTLSVTSSRAVHVSWGDGRSSQLTSHCERKVSAQRQRGCSRVVTHAYRVPGKVRISVAVGGASLRQLRMLVTAVTTVPAPPQAPSAWQADMLERVNVLRRSAGRDPLELCPTLSQVAQEHSADMAAKGYFDHTSQDGATPQQRAAARGYSDYTGENIAAGQRTVSDVMAAWTASPGHYANMTSARSTRVGFGMATNPDSEYRVYWTQDFGYGTTGC